MVSSYIGHPILHAHLIWTSGETPLTTPHWPSTPRLWRESAALNSWGCTSPRTSPGLPTPSPISKEGTTAPTLSPPAEKSKSPSTHPHHLLQGYHWERADQLHHWLVQVLLCSRPQDPPANSEHRCKNHWCPSPLHPGYFPYTMLQQSKKYRGGPHPPLPQSLPAPTLR